jgi:ribose-phosphate pyrophosphokinase
MKIFNQNRKPVPIEFVQYPAGEWRADSKYAALSHHRWLVIEASGMEPDFWVKAGLVSAMACMAGTTTKLALPYLPAARDDRQEAFGAHVYATLIDSLSVQEVHVFDPHSPIMVGTLNTKVVIHSSAAAIVDSVHNIGGILCPDKGAALRAADAAAALGVPVVHCTKVRDFETGRLSGFECPEVDPEVNWLVVDDICDGGGTFVGVAQASGLPKERLQLWVSHAIFSGRARQLVDYYSRIVTTNSYLSLTDVPCSRLPVHKYMPGLYE